MSSTGSAESVTDVVVPEELPPPRSKKGTFVKGYSGNPAGKAKGTRNAITMQRLDTEQALRDFIRPQAKAILKKAIQMALGGDTVMLKVLLDKTLSSLRTEDVGDTKDTTVQLTINNLTATAKDRRGEVVDGEIVPRALTSTSVQIVTQLPKTPPPGTNE